MRNWYQKFIKNSQANPIVGQTEEQTRSSIFAEKQAMMAYTINNFIVGVGQELKTQKLENLMNITNPTAAMRNALEIITSQIDTQNVLVQQTTELLQKVSGEVAKTILEQSARGNRTGNVSAIINASKSPIMELIRTWMNSYRVPDEEVVQATKK